MQNIEIIGSKNKMASNIVAFYSDGTALYVCRVGFPHPNSYHDVNVFKYFCYYLAT